MTCNHTPGVCFTMDFSANLVSLLTKTLPIWHVSMYPIDTYVGKYHLECVCYNSEAMFYDYKEWKIRRPEQKLIMKHAQYVIMVLKLLFGNAKHVVLPSAICFAHCRQWSLLGVRFLSCRKLKSEPLSAYSAQKRTDTNCQTHCHSLHTYSLIPRLSLLRQSQEPIKVDIHSDIEQSKANFLHVKCKQ